MTKNTIFITQEFKGLFPVNHQGFSNPRLLWLEPKLFIFDVGERELECSALYIENMEFLLPAGTALSLTFYIILVETLSVVCSIFILLVSLTLSAVNTRLHILSQRNIHQFEFPFESLCTWLQHICTQHLKPLCGCWLTTVSRYMYGAETGDTALADVMHKKILNRKQREIWTDDFQLS